MFKDEFCRKGIPLVDATNMNIQSIKRTNKGPKQRNGPNESRKGVSKRCKQSMNILQGKENDSPAVFVRIEREPVVEKRVRSSRLARIKDQAIYNNSPDASELSSVDNKHVPLQKRARSAGLRAQLRLKNMQPLINDSSHESEEQSNTLKDVYEFTFDPEDEAVASSKRILKEVIDNSTDMDNSMKNVMKSIRIKELKDRVLRKKLTSKSRKKRCVSRSGLPRKTVQRSMRAEPAEGDLDPKRTVIRNITIDEESEGCRADLSMPEIIEKSFNEEYSTGKREYVVVSGSTSREIDASSPWRVRGSNSHKPHMFVVKNKSFIPSYNQDMVLDGSVYERSDDGEYLNNRQMSLLDYADECERRSSPNSSTLFMSPRKILGEMNRAEQSTPRRSNDDRSLFGFSSDENEENCDPVAAAEPTTSVVTYKEKKKIKKTSRDEERPLHERSVVNQSFAGQPLPVEVGHLFQDVQGDKELRVKKSTFNYEMRRKVRKRVPSWSDTEECAPHTKATKEQDEEIDKLAAYYNSLFEEIDQHDLCIDGQ